jgi:predicted TIM-barrel fold metal-dependent hydrolase
MLPNAVRGVHYADPSLEPMWSAIEESGIPLNFHISETPDDNGPGGLGTYLAVSQQPFRKQWSFLVFSGILERHPDLQVVFAEGGISWIPSALDHADKIWSTFDEWLSPKLPRPPSEYWHRQCRATFMDDPMGIEQLAHIGAERVLWSSDYPHPEGTGESTSAVLARLRSAVGDSCASAITGGTACSVYGLSSRGGGAWTS